MERKPEIISRDIATFERKLAEAGDNAVLKEALNKKLVKLKQELKGGQMSTRQLASNLLGARRKISALSGTEFRALILRLSKKPEYSFLKRYSNQKVRDDMERPAKPVGYRFKGRGNYDKPTPRQIRKGKADGTVYYEARPRRSDVNRVIQLGKGGNVPKTYIIGRDTAEIYDYDLESLKEEFLPFVNNSNETEKTYEEGKDFEFAIARGDDFPNAIIITNQNLLKKLLADKEAIYFLKDLKGDGKYAKGGGVESDCTAAYYMLQNFIQMSNDEYIQDANIVPYIETNGVIVSYTQNGKKVAVIVYNPRMEKLSIASVVSNVMSMFPVNVQAKINSFATKYNINSPKLCSASLIKIVNHNGEVVEEFEHYAKGGEVEIKKFIAEEDGVLGVYSGSEAYSFEISKGDIFETVGKQDNPYWWFVKKVDKTPRKYNMRNKFNERKNKDNVIIDFNELILTFPKGKDNGHYAKMKEIMATGGKVSKRNYTYIPQDEIDYLVTEYGKKIDGSKLLDGAYAKGKTKSPKIVRTQFEDEDYEFAKGGNIDVWNLKKGDKIRTKKGDIETIERKIESGYFTEESRYSHPFESIEFVSRPSRKMETGGDVKNIKYNLFGYRKSQQKNMQINKAPMNQDELKEMHEAAQKSGLYDVLSVEEVYSKKYAKGGGVDSNDFKAKINLGKIAYEGRSRKNNAVQIEVSLKTKEKGVNWNTLKKENDVTVFSMSGGIWNPSKSDMISAGQNLDEIAKYFKSNRKVKELIGYWEEYHLNDMNAGTKKQTEAIEKWMKQGNRYDYSKALEYLESIDLDVDKGYKYGSQWLYKPIPKKAVDRIIKLCKELQEEKFEDGGSVFAAKKKMNKGGRIDLFEDYENIPEEVQEILNEYELEDNSYDVLDELLNRLEAVGYTFSYGLDAEPFGLRPIGVNLNELEGYEDEPDDDKMATGGSVGYIKGDKVYILENFSNNPYANSTKINGIVIDYKNPNVTVKFDNGNTKTINQRFLYKDKYATGGSIGEELMGGQPGNSKPSGYTLISKKGNHIIVSEDGGKTKEKWVKNNGYSGYTLHYAGNQYEFVDSFADGGNIADVQKWIEYDGYSDSEIEAVFEGLEDAGYVFPANYKIYETYSPDKFQQKAWETAAEMANDVRIEVLPSRLQRKDVEAIIWGMLMVGSTQYGVGGDVKAFFAATKHTLKKGYEKTKEYTKKQIHDGKKKVALDVLDDTKRKVSKQDKTHLRAAQKLVETKFAKGGRAWSGGIENIDNLFTWMYDEGILTKTEKDEKDKKFRAYYRYYNDGDFPRALASKGISSYSNEDRIKNALEEYIEEFIKRILKKYQGKYNRREFHITQQINDLKRLHYWVIGDYNSSTQRGLYPEPYYILYKYDKEIELTNPEFKQLVRELSPLYKDAKKEAIQIIEEQTRNGIYKGKESYEIPGDNNGIYYLRETLKENKVWTAVAESKFQKMQGIMDKMNNVLTKIIAKKEKTKTLIKNEPKYKDGGSIDTDKSYYRVFKNSQGKDIPVKIVPNPIMNKYDYYVNGGLRGSFKTYEDAEKEVSRENFELYRDGGNISESGLMVIGRTQSDNTKIGEIVDENDFYAEWNSREGYWLFPEEVENYDDLEETLSDLFEREDINARFEGIFAKGGCMYGEGGEITGKYALVMLGGSIGSKAKHPVYVNGKLGSIIATSDGKEELTEKAKRMRKNLSEGERKYYGMNYTVIELTPSKLKEIEMLSRNQ